MISRESKTSYQFSTYFEALVVEIHSCTGSREVGGKHLEILNVPHRHMQLQLREHSSFQGDVGSWFGDFLSKQGTTIPNLTCFRTEDGEALCSGTRTDTRGLVVCIPIMLILNVQDSTDPAIWNFPETLTPLTKKLATTEGVVYDLVGFGLHSQSARHFTARYVLKSHSEVFFFNGMQNAGYTILEEGASFATHLAGRAQDLAKGYSVTSGIYHLRGGSNAQTIFYETRRELYRKQFKLEIIGLTPDNSSLPTCSYIGNLTELPVESRTWIKNSKLRKLTVEYVSALPNAPLPHQEPPKHSARISTPELDIIALTDEPLSPESEEEMAGPSANLEHGHTSPTASELSLPDSVWTLNCRCGVNGDGNVLYRQEEGTTIQCSDCLEWSHVACQRDGRASSISRKRKFICDICEGLVILLPGYQKKQRESVRRCVKFMYMCKN